MHRLSIAAGASIIEGGSEALDPFQCSFVTAEQAATLSQHIPPVPLYMMALAFHSLSKHLLTGQYRRPTLSCFALLAYVAHIATLLATPRSLY